MAGAHQQAPAIAEIMPEAQLVPLSAVENADYLLALSGKRQGRGAITAALAAAGLQEQAWDGRLGGFSKGMRRVGAARRG